MKKLFLIIIIAISALTACKKNVVEPTNGFEQSSNSNKLPKKAIERTFWGNNSRRTVIKEFTYNVDGLLTKVTSYDSANASIVSTLAEFTYTNGIMQTSKQVDVYREIYNTYDKDGQLTQTTYKEKNGSYGIFKIFYHYDSQNRIDTIKTINHKDSSVYLNIGYAKSISGEDSVILSPFSVYDWGNDFNILNYGFSYAIKNDSVTYIDKSQGSYKVHYSNKAHNYQRELMEFLIVDMGYNTRDDFPYSTILKAWYKSYYVTEVNQIYLIGGRKYEYNFDVQDRLISIKSLDNDNFDPSDSYHYYINTTVIY
ncbi:MAG: hypothetical protein U0V72_11640 [Cytophagales bacterium]